MSVPSKQSRYIDENINILLSILFSYCRCDEDKNFGDIQRDRFVYNNGIRILL